MRAIAVELGRDPATISRELRRNRDPGSGQYRPFAAQRMAVGRRARPGRGKLVRDAVLRQFVAERLEKRWSPEQISQALRCEFRDEPERHVVHETIYQAIYRPELGGLRRDLQLRGHLPHGLHQRVTTASAVCRPPGRCSRMVNRPGGHPHDGAACGVAGRSATPWVRRSLTWDQGKEMALHAEIAQSLAMPVFFCDPHSPWQRPSNENTNGLLRQYFPKGSDLRVHGPDRLVAVAAELNARPRKILGWDSPTVRLTYLASTSKQADLDHE